jgi:hypothetical protein
VVLDQIKASPTVIWGWFDLEIRKAWSFIFPLTPESRANLFLPLTDPAWVEWSNPWWKFLTDVPLVVESRILSWRTLPGTSNEPILCELDPSEEISERRMLVEKPIAVSCMGNVALKKLIQVFQPNFQFKIAICQRELKMGILEHVVSLIQGTNPSLMLMKETGWSLLEQMRCLPQIDECPTPSHHLIMNIILWNCRRALNPHFQRTVADLVNRHSPAVLIITRQGLEVIVLRKLLVGFLLMVLLLLTPLVLLGVSGSYTLELIHKHIIIIKLSSLQISFSELNLTR